MFTKGCVLNFHFENFGKLICLNSYMDLNRLAVRVDWLENIGLEVCLEKVMTRFLTSKVQKRATKVTTTRVNQRQVFIRPSVN